MDQNHNDLMFSPWDWAAGRRRPSHTGALLDSPLVLNASCFHSSLKRDLPVVDFESDCKVISFHQTSPSSSLLSPLSLSAGFDSDHLNSIFHQDGLQAGFERSCATELPQGTIEDDEALSPLDWISGCRNLLASPFSEDSDSDDGLSPSPFSSPESSNQTETDDETGGYLFSPPSTQGRAPGYHPLRQYPNFELFHDRIDDDATLSCSPPLSPPTIPDGHIPGVSFTHHVIEDGLQSPLLSPAPLPCFNSFYYFDHLSSVIPGSPRYRAVDLPALDNESDSKANHLGLGLHSTGPSYPYEDFHSAGEVPPPSGISHRTTWLSLPGADTDDDLIPAELGSKTYIPDPSITIPTTPPSRSLLIWDPTTRSGLPAGLPLLDGTGHTTRRLDVDALPIARPLSPDEDFDVDPALLAKLAEQDAEKVVEVQKLCELKQRTNIAAVAYKGREGAQLDAERVRERWREVTALLRLKLASDEEKSKTTGYNYDAREEIVSGGAAGDGESPSSAPLLTISPLISSLLISPSPTSTSFSESPTGLTSQAGFNSNTTSPQIIRRRTSKPKITSMAQLVANMVFHRQQDLRRSPTRGRTWPPLASTTQSAATSKTRSWTQTSPTSPLRQMILPEDLDVTLGSEGDAICGSKDCDSPLQLSPLCLGLYGSPESFYAQLDAAPIS